MILADVGTRGVPVYEWGPRQYAIAFLLGVVTFITTLVILRIVAQRRGRSLRARVGGPPGTWACLCQVREGEWLLRATSSRPVPRPRGVLSSDSECLTWIPDRSEKKRGYQSRVWVHGEVQVAAWNRRRDLTGLPTADVTLVLGGATLRVIPFMEVGRRPDYLRSVARGS